MAEIVLDERPHQALGFVTHLDRHDQRYQIFNFTGNAKVDFTGPGRGGDGWALHRLRLNIEFTKPKDHRFLLVDGTAHVTLSCISNDRSAQFAGWAVDTAQVQVREGGEAVEKIPVLADLRVRDNDGHILAVGYNVMVKGVWDPPLPTVEPPELRPGPT